MDFWFVYLNIINIAGLIGGVLDSYINQSTEGGIPFPFYSMIGAIIGAFLAPIISEVICRIKYQIKTSSIKTIFLTLSALLIFPAILGLPGIILGWLITQLILGIC